MSALGIVLYRSECLCGLVTEEFFYIYELPRRCTCGRETTFVLGRWSGDPERKPWRVAERYVRRSFANHPPLPARS